MGEIKSEFTSAIETAKIHQKNLQEIYRNNIGLVNDLKTRSKIYMNQVSDLEEGLSLNKSNSTDDIELTIEKLANDIERFNQEIGENTSNFNTEIELIIEQLSLALAHYKGKSGELSSILEMRKQLLYLSLVLRKFKSKIVSLQLMNNALFAFSDELQSAKIAYRSNLINVSSSVVIALDFFEEKVAEIEKLG